MDKFNIDYLYVLNTILYLSSIIGLWTIFENNNEKGWKSLIPFYSTYTFAKTFHEEKLGKKLAWAQAVFSIAFISLLIIFIVISIFFFISFALSFMVLFQSDVFFEIFRENFPTSTKTITIVLSVISLISFIFVMYYHIELHYIYNKLKNIPTWFMLIWVFLPSLGYLYFAFIYGKYDIPGLKTVQKEDIWD